MYRTAYHKVYGIMILQSIYYKKGYGSRLSTIIITRQLHNNLVSLAKNSLPNESCALLVGKNKGEKVYVVDSIPNEKF